MKKSQYKYGFSAIPWQLLDMLSDKAYKAFGKIYQCIYMNCNSMSDGVEIPGIYFKGVIGKHGSTIIGAIKELEAFNIISVKRGSRQKNIYYINWNELNSEHDILATLNHDGREAVFDLARKNELPLSALPQVELKKIYDNVKLTQKMNESSLTCSKNERVFGNEQETHSKNERVFVQKVNKFGIQAENTLTVASDLDFSAEQIDENTILVHFLNQNSFKICTSFRKLVQKMNTYNSREENYKKLSDERSESYIEEKEVFESSKNFQSFSEPLEEVFESSKNFQSFSKPLEEVGKKSPGSFEEDNRTDDDIARESQKRRERMKNRNKERAEKLPDNPYYDKPYFSKKELEDFTWDINLCVDSPVRLYLYNFFSGLLDYYDNTYAELPDDDNEEQSNDTKFSDLDGMLIPSSDLQQIAFTAFDEFQGQVEKGLYEFEDGESVKINFKEFPEFDWRYLCDWSKSTARAMMFKINLATFRNIEAEDMSQASAIKELEEDSSGVRDTARNRQYAAYLSKTNDNTLTTIEDFQKLFLKKHIKFDETRYHTIGCMNNDGYDMTDNKTLPYHAFDNFSSQLIRAGINPEQFFSTLVMNEAWKKGMPIYIAMGVFSYKKTQQLNSQLGYESQITLQQLDDALPV